MKTGRLLGYAVAGMIAGLLIENSVLRLRRKAEQGIDDAEKMTKRQMKKARKAMQAQFQN